MNYSTEKDDYLMTTPYTKKIQQKFEKVTGNNSNADAKIAGITPA